MVYVNSINAHPSDVTIELGKWYYGTYAEINPADATCKSVDWSSDNPAVASVNETMGFIYGNALGTAKITATAKDGSGKSDYINVTVSNCVAVDSLELNQTSISLQKGNEYALYASIYPEHATCRQVAWTSGNSSIATVDENGRVTAISEGATSITATLQDGSGRSVSCSVTVVGDTLVTLITLDESVATMLDGESMYLYASVYPENATNNCLFWSSSDTSVVTVNETNGYVYAQGEGCATIYASATDGSGVRGACEITVLPPISATGVIVCPKKCIMIAGETRELCVEVQPVFATNQRVRWESDTPRVATVDKNGVVTAVSDGTAIITARTYDGGFTASCTVTVDSRERVKIKKDSHSFYVEFADGKVWKNIGCVITGEGTEEELVALSRYDENKLKIFTIKQLALIYLFDPLGIRHYMRIGNVSEINPSDLLYFKDDLYKEIFGKSPKYFLINDNGQRYDAPTNLSRDKVFSDAELIFGMHNPICIESLIDLGFDILISAVESVFYFSELKSKVLSWGLRIASEAIQIIFFSGSIIESLSDLAIAFVDEYIGNDISKKDPIEIFNWTTGLFELVEDGLEKLDDSFAVLNVEDVSIYNKIQKQKNYRVIFENQSQKFFIEDILEACS